MHAGLDEPVCHGLIVLGEGGCLGDGRAKASLKQPNVVKGDGVDVLCQCIHTVAPGTCHHLKGLHPEGAETTVDCPGPHVSYGYAGILNVSVSQGGCLGMLPGTVEGLTWPCGDAWATSNSSKAVLAYSTTVRAELMSALALKVAKSTAWELASAIVLFLMASLS